MTFRLNSFEDYPDREARDRRARFLRAARRAERGERFMLRLRVPFIVVALVLAAVGWGCDSTEPVPAVLSPERIVNSECTINSYTLTARCDSFVFTYDVYDPNGLILGWVGACANNCMFWTTTNPVVYAPMDGWQVGAGANQIARFRSASPRVSGQTVYATPQLFRGELCDSWYDCTTGGVSTQNATGCGGGGKDPDPNQNALGVPVDVDLSGLSEREVSMLERFVNNEPGDRYGQDFRMAEEFRALWDWFCTLTPEQRAAVLHNIRYQMALNGTGPAYLWGFDPETGWFRYTTSEGTSTVTGLR